MMTTNQQSIKQIRDMMMQSINELIVKPSDPVENYQIIYTTLRFAFEEVLRKSMVQSYTIGEHAVVTGFKLDNLARVWLKLSNGEEKRAKRFMSRRLAKKYGKSKIGVGFMNFEFLPNESISYVNFKFAVKGGINI